MIDTVDKRAMADFKYSANQYVNTDLSVTSDGMISIRSYAQIIKHKNELYVCVCVCVCVHSHISLYAYHQKKSPTIGTGDVIAI